MASSQLKYDFLKMQDFFLPLLCLNLHKFLKSKSGFKLVPIGLHWVKGHLESVHVEKYKLCSLSANEL